MAVASEFKELVVEHDLVPPVAHAAHAAACILLQMLVTARGHGPWIAELQQQLGQMLERDAAPEGHAEWARALWHGTQRAELDTIFATAELVFEGSERRH